MQTRFFYLLRFFLPLIDLIMLNSVYLLSFYISRDWLNLEGRQWHAHYLIVSNLIWFINSYIFKLYSEFGARRIERIYRATWRTVLLHGAIFACYIVYSKNTEFARLFLACFYIFLIIACVINRFFGTLIQYIMVKKFKVTRKIGIMGNNYTAARLRQYFKQQNNVEFYGFIGTHDGLFTAEDGSISPETVEQIKSAVEDGVKDLYVCIPPEKMDNVITLMQEADKLMIRIKFVPDLGGILMAPYEMTSMVGQFPVITIRREPLEQMPNRFKKRSFDFIFSALVIILILSWLYPLIGLLIKIQSKGPVLFKQQRSGRNDIPFWCYKFRSMTVNSSSHTQQASIGDARITPIGKFLRKFSLDELPQFFNVFFGQMSVVGPRPHMLKHTVMYGALIEKFMVRHFAKPGITGWAQVNGYRGETKETEDMQNRVEHDIYYLENWTLMWDIKIVFLTIINIFQGEENAF